MTLVAKKRKRRWPKTGAFFLVAFWQIKGNASDPRLREEGECEEKKGRGLTLALASIVAWISGGYKLTMIENHGLKGRKEEERERMC